MSRVAHSLHPPPELWPLRIKNVIHLTLQKRNCLPCNSLASMANSARNVLWYPALSCALIVASSRLYGSR